MDKITWNRRTGIFLVVIISIAVVGGVLVWAKDRLVWGSCGCPPVSTAFCTVTPCPGREALTLDSFQINSPTNITLNIRNTGQMSITLIAYYVKDTTGDLSGNSQWSGPSVSPNNVLSTNVIIDGQAFTFHSGNLYTVEVVTSRGNQYYFTVNM